MVLVPMRDFVTHDLTFEKNCFIHYADFPDADQLHFCNYQDTFKFMVAAISFLKFQFFLKSSNVIIDNKYCKLFFLKW